MVLRFMHFGVLCIAKYRYGEKKIFPVTLKFFPIWEIRHPRINSYL
jgi:hypothetical protein